MAQDSDVKLASQATLREALDDYLKTLKPEQHRAAFHYVSKYVEYMGDDFAVSALSGARVEAYAEERIKANDPSAQNRVAALKAWFAFLKKKQYTDRNFGVNIRVKKATGKPGTRSTTRVREEQPVEMTAEGIEALSAELADIESQIPEMERAIAVAREDGDIRENAPYHAAREALAFKNHRKTEIETALKRAVVVDRGRDDRSAVGSLVTVTDLGTNKQVEYRLVGPREANAGERKISVESPVGRQLLGRRAGDEVEIQVPSGHKQFRVDAVTQS